MEETKCKICGGSGYLRQELDCFHPEFGKLIPCECRIEEFPELGKDEEEPEERNPDLSWLEYTE